VRRRDFIKGIAGSTVVWPLLARAQQMIRFLRSTSAADSEHLVVAFEQGLKEAGFIAGQTVAIDYRWGNDQLDRLPELAVPAVNSIRLASAAESDDPPRHAGSLLGNF
jgi:putative ABC transport system substrate-binding protein